MSGKPLPRAEALLRAGIREGLHLGGQLYVSRAGRPMTDLAVGLSRPGVPMTTETLVLWLSSTKPVAAVAVARLWERGLLELDDPVARHIPEFGQRGKEDVTIRHLLTHTSGIRLLRLGWPHDSWSEILDRICRMRLEPRAVPGKRAAYHLASSWFVLGELVRRLDGRPFARYVREEIFVPLGMESSWVGMPVERYRAYGERIGAMFDTETQPPEDHRWDREIWVTGCHPGGNGFGPIRELGRFYEMLLAGGRLGDARILRPQTVEALTARHRAGMYDHTFRVVLDWGLGFILNSALYHQEGDLPYAYGRHASRRTYGHSGYRSSTAFADPEHRLVVALAVNGTPSEENHRRRFRLLTEAVYEDLGLTGEVPVVESIEA